MYYTMGLLVVCLFVRVLFVCVVLFCWSGFDGKVLPQGSVLGRILNGDVVPHALPFVRL